MISLSISKQYSIAIILALGLMSSMPVVAMGVSNMKKIIDAVETLKDYTGLPHNDVKLMQQYIDAHQKTNDNEWRLHMEQLRAQQEQEKNQQAQAKIQEQVEAQKREHIKHANAINERNHQAKLDDDLKKKQAQRQLENAQKAAEFELKNKKEAAELEKANKIAAAQEEDRLKRAREKELAKEKEEQQKRMNEEQAKFNEEQRKKTVETELKAKIGFLKAESKLKDTDPLVKKNLEEKAKLEQEARVAVESTRITAITNTFNQFFDHPTRMKKAAAIAGTTVALAASAILAARYAFPVVAKYVEEKLFVPSLIQETSQRGIFARLFGKKQKSDNPMLKDLHFSPELADRMNEIKLTLKNTAKNNGYFQNYIFYGEPGTGKTATARALAAESGIDYILMTGGDVAPLLKSGKAIEKLKEIVAFAKNCPNGAAVFVDEADAFLKDPNSAEMTEELYAVLNTFLNLSGTESKKISWIFSTNHPHRLPPAIRDRVGAGQMIHFGLPELPERIKIVTTYVKKYIKANHAINSSALTVELARWIAQQTEGLSGRGLSLLILSMEKAALAQPKPVLTEAIIKRCVNTTMAEHGKKLTTYA